MTDAPPLLARLVSPDRPPIHEQTLVVVAHPDDETLACGGLLARIPDLTVVHVTDGAPADGRDAVRHGFADTSAYAAERRRELQRALAALGAAHARLFQLGLRDQEAALAMADSARRLVHRVGKAQLVLTHAYEGGHPDHDACAFAVHAATALLSEQGRAPPIVEMPLYREGEDGGWARLSFPDGGSRQVVLRLSDDERARKAAAIAAHASQRATLAGFGVADEVYRLAQRPDFTRPPNEGRVLYERYQWGMTGARFIALARDAYASLGLEPPR